MKIFEGKAGDHVLLLGNEAIARGALEAGVGYVSGYPGTPSTEALEALIEASSELGFYAEISTNEKVALEVALGASLCGGRAMATMKHVGLNVAADTFMSIGYSGVEGGLVILVADDPYAHSSQNEQDTRLYGMHAYIPVLEPWEPNEAKEVVKYAFEMSERHKTAVIVRSTTRLSHTRSEVVLGELASPVLGEGFRRDFSRWVLLPANSRRLHGEALERADKISRVESAFSWLYEGHGEVGIVASGIAYGYVREALKDLNLDVPLLKLSLTYPLPRSLVEDFFNLAQKEIVVVEELDPVVELQLRSLADELEYSGRIRGKDLLPRVGELNTIVVKKTLADIFGLSFVEPELFHLEVNVPPRPPTLCPGCGHRAMFYAIKMASKRMHIKGVYPGDIGCYTLGFFPPFRLVDTSYCMGSGLGIGLGVSKASSDEVVIATIGDSTFFHAGIPALIDAVYNSHPVVLVVMDNSLTAMTGHQPHPGTGFGYKGEQRPKVYIEDVARAIGVKFVRIVDPYDVKRAIRVLSEAINWVKENNAPAVVIARKLCALYEYRQKLRRGEKVTPYYVDEKTCTGCRVCTDMFGCPAISMKDNKAFIISDICVGCGVCAEICPFNAIKKEGGSS